MPRVSPTTLAPLISDLPRKGTESVFPAHTSPSLWKTLAGGAAGWPHLKHELASVTKSHITMETSPNLLS